MNNATLTIYFLLALIALCCAGYNWMYQHEIHRSEKQIGIAIPASFFQLLHALIFISLLIAGISITMLLLSI